MKLCTINCYFILIKGKWHSENLVKWGDTTMTHRTCVKQTRYVYPIKFNKKVQQPHKILKYRDWRIDWYLIGMTQDLGKSYIYKLVHWDIKGHYVVHGETVLWVHVLIVSLFHKSITGIVTDFEREFRMQALCGVLVCMVVIYLGGGVELAFALLCSIAGRTHSSSIFFVFK